MDGFAAFTSYPLCSLESDSNVEITTSEIEFTTGEWRVSTQLDPDVIIQTSEIAFETGTWSVCVDGYRELEPDLADIFTDISPIPDLGCVS